MFELKDVKRAMEIVKNLDLPRDFGIDVDDDFDTYNIEEQISDVMNDSFFVTNGVSKMVIVPNELPFVIKIPFNGRWVSNFDCAEEEEECEEFWYFMMAESRMSGDDYCARELELTAEIKAEGFGEFVPDMMYVGRCCGHNVYIQEKVKPMSECSKTIHPTEDSLNKSRQINAPFLDAWAALVIDTYGEDNYNKFLEWARENEPDVLSDMHTGNYGINMNGNPILLDICGFRD